jgi:hypothetical protein
MHVHANIEFGNCARSNILFYNNILNNKVHFLSKLNTVNVNPVQNDFVHCHCTY